MVQVSTLLAAVLSSGLLVSGSPTFTGDASLAPREYTVGTGPIEWKGALEEGGEEIQLSGTTFDDIEAKAKALNPNYTIFEKAPAAIESRDLAARQTESINCGWPPGWRPTPDFTALHYGIEYLRGISGNCRGRPGPSACDRVSCSWKSAIFYCNDNRHEIWVPCRQLGDVAAAIVSRCGDQGHNGRTLGQAFDRGHWNVIVAESDC
ncbi:hypothetical protein B0T14DRAFT_565219 [Immersiella caudata]|uniref:Uncharacterized protein n=1 Tax=Immersiella caudata TaxID=314043 RepID=A0AA40C3Q0_9PEZI|nr:hypothetical protein B0T14DRAFT_565219 [Immersiella caudata]